LAQGKIVGEHPHALRHEARQLAGKTGARACRQYAVLHEEKRDWVAAAGEGRRELLKGLAIRTVVRVAGFHEHEMSHGVTSVASDVNVFTAARDIHPSANSPSTNGSGQWVY